LVSGDWLVVLPIGCLISGAAIVYLTARFAAMRNDLLAVLTASTFAAALVGLVLLWPATNSADLPTWGYGGSDGAFLQADPGAVVIVGAALALGLLVAIYSGRYLALDQRYETFYPLLLLLAAGLVGLLFAGDLFNLYMFSEVAGAAAYVLVAFRRYTRTSIEAGFKYLMMGGTATIIVLMGVSFVYRETGSIRLTQAISEPGIWARAGIACLLAGLGLKSAIIPLHTWLPDAHSRAPSSISAMLSGVVVQSSFYALVKTCLGLGLPGHILGSALIVFSLLNMLVGNGLALVQTHTKRLLAYSTIAQVGYLMLTIGIGLRYAEPAAIQAGFFLILAQATMKGLAFLCKGACHFYCGTTTVEQLRGTAANMPLIAGLFSTALLGLAGVPPLAGFAGKWFVLRGALHSADPLGTVGLVAFLLNSVLALGYYLPLIGRLFAPPTTAEPVKLSPWMAVPIVALGVVTLAMGLYPALWLRWTANVGSYLLGLGLPQGSGG
jgi:proton-translocating NADH-quinone oxidoreductase chain N